MKTQRTLGVDVSHWEGAIDWTVAAPFVPFAYYKCTEGISFFDNQFLANKKGCMDAGMPHAPYHYYKPDQDIDAQVANFAGHIGDGYNVAIIDVEDPPAENYQYQARLKSFCEKTHEATQLPIAIYTSPGFWNEFCADPYPSWCHAYPLIVANYTITENPTKLPVGFDGFVIWQFSKYFYIPGCKEIVDGNWFMGDLQAARKWFGNYRPVDNPFIVKSRVRSLFDHLHIRSLPSTTGRELGALSKGETVELDDLGGKEVWVKHDKGWSCVEREGYRYMEVIK